MGKTFLMSPPVFYFIFPLKFQTKQGFLHLSIPETQQNCFIPRNF